jgi:putative ABC transport system substrate-binding protein
MRAPPWRPGRRALIAGLAGAVLAPAAGHAQPDRPRRVAVLSPGADAERPIFVAFRETMRALGYVDGRNVEIRFHMAADAGPERLSVLARELVSSPVDVIVADGGAATDAARGASTQVPIVAIIGGDPVGRGIVASLARPGGNITGVTIYSLDLAPKQVELFREIAPASRRLLLLSGLPDVLRATAEVGQRMGLQTTQVQARSPAAVAQALAAAALAEFDGVIVLPDPVTAGQRVDVVARINAARLPAIYPDRDFALEGGLISYGSNLSDVYRRLAGYVDRILKGANPGELPIERPGRIELVVNLRTARTLAIAIPQTLLTRADEVIE